MDSTLAKILKSITLLAYILPVLFLFCGCREKNEQYFLAKGKAVQLEIVETVRYVHTLQDLLVQEETLTRLFSELASLAIQADQWKNHHKLKNERNPSLLSNDTSCLEEEIHRIFSIPGAKAFLEKCQKVAMDKLDIYLNSRTLTPNKA